MANVITLRLDTDNGTYLCDAFENSSIQITKRVQSIDTISNSQGVVTEQTFRAPLKGAMLEALGDISDIQVSPKVDLRKSINGAIIINGYPRFTGSYQVIGIYSNKNNGLSEVELIFKGSETDLKAELSKIKLSDLMEGELIPYQIGEIYQYITDTENYISDNGYSWALIDYGRKFAEDGSGRHIFSETEPLQQTAFKPQVFMSKVFDKLPIPITVDSSAVDLLNQVIPLHNNERLYPTLDTNPLNYTGRMATTTTRTYLNYNVTDTPTFFKINYDLAVNNDQVVFDSIGDSYTAKATGFHTVSMNTIIESYGLDLIVRAAIKNLTTGVVFTSSFTRIKLAPGGYRQATIELDTGVILEKSNVYEFGVSLYQTYSASLNYDIKIVEGSVIQVTSSPELIGSSNVDIAANCPDVTAWDCVKTIITQCNGILEPTESGYNIKPWVKWIDEGTVFNIDDKINKNKDVNIEPTNVTGAKSILLSYKDDGDVLNKIYKDLFDGVYGQLLIEDTGTDFTDKQYKLDVPFAATPMTYVADTNVVIPKFISDGGETVKPKPRLIYHNTSNIERMGGSIFLKDVFGTTVFQTDSGFPYIGHWEKKNGGYNTNDYNFGTTLNFFASSNFPNNTLYERFWKKYITETYGINSRKVKLSLLISQNDFDNLKMNEKVYYNNTMFRFLSINNKDLINNEYVNCEFVYRSEISNLDIAPYYPYNIANQIVQFKNSSDNTVVALPNPSDLQESCEAYGYYYDSNLNQCVQRGNIIQV